MPNLSNVTAEHQGNTVRVRGAKGSSVTVRAYLNPNLTAFPTAEALFNAFELITTPKAQDGSTNLTFDLNLSVGNITAPYSVKVVSSDGKAEAPLVVETLTPPIRTGAVVS